MRKISKKISVILVLLLASAILSAVPFNRKHPYQHKKSPKHRYLGSNWRQNKSIFRRGNMVGWNDKSLS